MKGQKILKVTSILMIIGGVIAVVVGVLAILGISALAALSGSTEGIGLLYASSIPEGSFLHQVGHYHCNFDHHLYDHRPGGRRNIQHHQSGSQSAAAGALCLWRCAGEE